MLVADLLKSVLGVSEPPPSYEPWLPFYSLKGRQGFTWVDLPLPSGRVIVPTLLKPVHFVLEGWPSLWRVTEPCRSHGGRITGTAEHRVNSGKGHQIVALINLPHSLSSVRQHATVKEVKVHSERGRAVVPRVVGTVVNLPCCGTGVIAPITSWVWVSCGRSLAALVDRDPAPEPRRGWARRNLRSRP